MSAAHAAAVARTAAPIGPVPIASVDGLCTLIGNKLRSVEAQKCRDLHMVAGDAASRRGLPLVYRDFLPRSHRRTPFRVLLIGGIHGDELTAVSMVFQWMQKLESERLQPFHWRVIPSSNPDGLLHDPSQRVNAGGVDLNRNFGTPDWDSNAKAYWMRATHSDPRRYPGPTSLSEPESRWLTQQIRQFRPDAVISVHAPYGVLDYDGPLDPPQRFGYLRLQPLGIYPGSLGNYAGVTLGLSTITLELPHSGIMPTFDQSQRIYADMMTWLEENLPKSEPPLFMRLEDEPWR